MNHKGKIKLFILGTFTFFCSCTETAEKKVEPPKPAEAPVENIAYKVVQSFPHDITLFTEGLLWSNGHLYESTGSPEELEVKSMIGISDLKSGKFEKKIELDKKIFFGEGIVILNDKVYQLTYKNQTGFIYDSKTFKKLGEFKFSNAEGWGLTTNGSQIIMSDGTETLSFWDPVNMQVVKTLKVTDNGLALPYINELEFINGFIYANVWTTNFIVKIDPESGKVMGRIDLAPLVYEARTKNPKADVLNGIAYDAAANKIYVTGKLWPNIYELDFPH